MNILSGSRVAEGAGGDFLSAGLATLDDTFASRAKGAGLGGAMGTAVCVGPDINAEVCVVADTDGPL